MKLQKLAGATSEIWQVFIRDSSSTTGAGLTGLAYNTSGLTAYFHRDTDTSATAITLATMTAGTFTSGGFVQIDSTNMPGWYQFCPPNAALSSGAKSCGIHLKGATNMAPIPIEVQLTLVNPDSADLTSTQKTSVGTAVLDAALSGHTIAGSVGAGISSASSAGDPWATAIPASYASGTAGNIVGNNLNAQVSTRLATSGYTAPPTASQNASAVLTTQMTESYAADGNAPTLTQAVLLTQQMLTEGSVSGTTMTVKKLDGATPAATLTINSSSSPTSITRTS